MIFSHHRRAGVAVQHNTAVIKDRKTSELWTVDPWTHKGSEVPDIFPLEKCKAGD